MQIEGVDNTFLNIVLIEFKAADSQLFQRQRMIKKMVERGSFRFEMHRISSAGVYSAFHSGTTSCGLCSSGSFDKIPRLHIHSTEMGQRHRRRHH
jgi:hypothetical protein